MSQITKQAMANSLKHLLEKKALSKITIKDIVEDCGVNRQTFYYHFQDVYDLVEWIFYNDLDKVIGDKRYYTNWHEGCRRILDYMQQNKKLVLNVYYSVNRVKLEDYFKSWMHPMLADIVKELTQDISIQDEDREFVTDVYLSMLVGLFMQWVEHDMPQEKLRLLDKLFCCLDGSIRQMLEKFSQKNI